MRPTLFTCVFFIAFASTAQHQDFTHLDKVLDSFEKQKKAMGSIAFSENGVKTYARAFGFSQRSTQTKADTLTKYRIGSVSKMFSATIILQLAAEGKLGLQDKLSRFFPAWPNASKITMEHLLRHESGLYNFGKSRDKKYQNSDPKTREEIIAIFEKAPIAFEPGKQVDYNNANYVVLSLVIEAIDKSSFAASIHTRIIEPLALQNTHSGGPIDTAQNEANSYFWKNKWLENEDFFMPSLLGAGALVSTPSDLNVFLHALFTHKILPEAQLREMMQLRAGMGLGLYALPFYEKTAYGHSGNIDAFDSFAAYFPKEKLAFSICLNGNRKDLNAVLLACLQAYFGY